MSYLPVIPIIRPVIGVARRRTGSTRGAPDVPSTDSHAPSRQYFCEGGDQQQWRFVPVAGLTDTFTGINRQSGKCLDVSALSTADGAAVQQWDCTGGTNQQFTLRRVTYSGATAQDHQLIARHSGKCVDVRNVSTTAREPIHQWPCNPTTQNNPQNQTWRLLGR